MLCGLFSARYIHPFSRGLLTSVDDVCNVISIASLFSGKNQSSIRKKSYLCHIK